MRIRHQDRSPSVDPDAYVAPTAVLSGEVTVGAGSCILHGAVVTADGGPVELGRNCIVMENAVLRGTRRHPLRVGDHVLIGPRSYLTGCTVEDSAFLATGSTVFNGAVIGTRSEIRINGTVHLLTQLPAESTVPIGWVAVGRPAEILPPERHDRIWELQEPLDFPKEIFGLERADPGATIMPELTRRYSRFLRSHATDQVLDRKPSV